MSLIVDTVNHPIVTSAKALFLKYSKDPEFLDRIRAAKFKYTKHTSDEIARKILEDTSEIHLKSYKTTPKVIASTSGKTIRFNLRALWDPATHQERAELIAGRTNTLMHEYVHTLGYTHKGNKNTPFNQETPPYKIGRMFEEYVKSKQVDLAESI